MPKKEISIAEALSVLKKKGLKVTVESVLPEPQSPVTIKQEEVKEKAPKGFKSITLRAPHCINGVMYGPGRVVVPIAVAESLVSQDNYAVRVDEAFRANKHEMFVIVKKETPVGQAFVGVKLDDKGIHSRGIDLGRIGESDNVISL